MNKVRINIVVAMDEKRGIGLANKMPWHISEDLLRLKRLTKDQVVILGRKSYDSMVGYYDKSGKEMPGRKYIVISGDSGYAPVRKNAVVVHSVDEALREVVREQEVFVIGGASVFEQVMGLADRLFLTLVRGDFHCDRFFPDYAAFTRVISEEERSSEGVSYRFLELERE